MRKLKMIFFVLTALSSLLCQNLFSNDCHDKWIVVTTINYPSAALKKLASIKDWRLVVIGDNKTPRDWKLENCEFLSIEDQKKLDFEIVKILPENHYSRKNIGYLYAISKGAKIIYETDDDNLLIGELSVMKGDEQIVELYNNNNSSLNVFAYFGQPKIWPRGFPLDQIASSNNFLKRKTENPRYGIIQGLIDKDPDVDAIFRLTQYRDVFFEIRPPCVLSAGTFCPFNTQNTIFSYESFWGMMIPTTTSFRVCDIWRSYIVQRLLWDLDLRLCFTAPFAVQERNQHDLFKDFCDEQDLYLKSGELIQFLLAWKNNSEDFSDRIQSLISDLVISNYLKAEEIYMIQAWIRDLKKLGYEFPKMNLK